MAKKDINRIKIVLVENKRTAKWLADALDVDVRTLIVQTKKSRIEIEAEKLLNISPKQ